MSYMNQKKILSVVDHTLLKQEATLARIKELCDDAISFKTASVCIPPGFVRDAAEYVSGGIAVCTVIGFPNGYSTAEAKLFECEDALKNGAAEIDMVVNIGHVKDKMWDCVESEIRRLKQICKDHILKVIIEACLLNEEEKIKMCEAVTNGGADFIKTSTGFSTGGATREDIALFKKYIGPGVRIKAAGGIRSWQDAEDFIALGANRLGTSALVALAKSQNNKLSSY